VDVRQRGSGALLRFSRTIRNPVTVDVFQTSARGRVTAPRRVARYANRQTSVRWSGRSTRGRRLSDGVYYVRFRMTDAQRRVDVRRVTVERRNGRFVARRGFVLPGACR